MTYGTVRGTARPLSRLILGAGPFRPERQEAVDALLDAFLAAGGSGVDTAYVYGAGASERALGAWLASRRARERVFLITKGAHPDEAWRPRLRREVVAQELEESLERLGTDHVDLYLLHRDDPAVPVGEVLEWLEEHVAAGRVRAYGASNWSVGRLAEAAAYAAAHGLRGFAASSPFFALAVAYDPPHMGHAILNGDPEARAWYRATGLPLLAWSSQAQGFFSDRADPGPGRVPAFARYDRPDNWERRRRVRALAERRGCTPTQVALAWVLGEGDHVFAIVGPGTVAHLEEALGALALGLTEAERAWLNLEGAAAEPGPGR